MNRNGTTILTGTVLLSMLLSPVMRVPEPGAPAHAAESKAATKPLGRGRIDQCETAACREAVHKEIQQEAGDEYLFELKEKLAEVCQTQDYRLEEQAAKSNKTTEEMEPAVEKKQEQLTSLSEKCWTPGNFIIALVPDPTHTHLALLFDRTVDAIEEAVQDEGYNFDRALMPWDSKAHPDSDDYEDRLEAEWYQKGKEDYPGLIAFRLDNPDSGEGRTLFVLVVGETPTAGIHEEQFRHAVEFIEKNTKVHLRSGTDWRANPNQEPGLRILGPMFSGSMPSLAKLLACGSGAASKSCYPLVSIHSGSVSSRDDIIKFDRQEQPYNVHFVSLHESDEVMEERFLEFLAGKSYEAARPFNPFLRLYGMMKGIKDYQGGDSSSLSDRHYAAKDIAVLSEDETAYGSSNRNEDKQQDQAVKDTLKKMGSHEYCESDAARKNEDCFLKLYFPREISQLRAAYQDSLVMSPATTDGRTPPRDTLPSNFSVPGSDDDTVASYSAKQMPLSQESVLLDLVSELQRHNIKFIILRATDPMDTLFLSEFLRTAYPAGRIVTLEADLLFRHEVSDPRLHGLLSLGTYSPAPAASHYFASYESGHVERIFPGSLDAGTYNATRSLLSSWVTDSVTPGMRTQDDDEPARACRHLLTRHDGVFASRPTDVTKTMVAVQVTVRNSSDKKISVKSISATLKIDGNEQSADAVSLSDYSSQLTAYPELKRFSAKPIGTGSAIMPGGDLSGTVLVAFPVSKQQFSARKDLSVTILRSDDSPMVWHEPAELPLYQYGWLWERFGDGNSDPKDDTQYDAPAVRLLALGRDDYWPIATFGPYTDEKSLTTLPRVHNQMSGKLQRALVPNSWRVVQLVGILLGLGLSISIWYASVFARTQAVAKYAPATADGRMKAVFAAGLTQMLILLILLWPSVHNAESGEANLNIFLEFTAIVVFLCTSADLVNRTLLTSLSEPSEPWRRWRGWAMVIAFVVLSGYLAFNVFLNQPIESKAYLLRFSTLRAMQLTSGLSFIMPTFFFLTVWLWWAEHSTAGYALLDARRPRLPEGMIEPSVQNVSEQIPMLQRSLRLTPKSRIFNLVLVAMVFLVSWYMGDHSHALITLENNFIQWVMWIFFTLAITGVIVITLRLWVIWAGVRKLLVALDSLPLRSGFTTIKGFSWNPIWRYGAGNMEDFQRIFFRKKEALDRALNTYPLDTGDLQKNWDQTLRGARDLAPTQSSPLWGGSESPKDAALSQGTGVQQGSGASNKLRRAQVVVANYFKSWWARRQDELQLIQQFGKFQEDVAKVTGKALDLLARSWQQTTEAPKRSPRETPRESLDDLALRAWENCVCMVYVNFLLAMLVRIRTLIVAVGGMFVLTMIGVTQYPFEPKAYIQVMLAVLFVFIVGVVGLVFAQIHRDTTLSNITDTTPGELGTDFWLRMISFTALPLFTLLASQFPSINRLFYSWLQPALQALNR
jgi:hypothetical protein